MCTVITVKWLKFQVMILEQILTGLWLYNYLVTLPIKLMICYLSTISSCSFNQILNDNFLTKFRCYIPIFLFFNFTDFTFDISLLQNFIFVLQFFALFDCLNKIIKVNSKIIQIKFAFSVSYFYFSENQLFNCKSLTTI